MIVSFLWGVAFGLFFFGGLAWTVKRGLSAKNPALVFFFSFVIRFGVVLCGLVLVSSGHIERIAACLAGFLVARPFVTRRASCI